MKTKRQIAREAVTFGYLVGEARKRNKLTPEQLGKNTGFNAQTIRNIEGGGQPAGPSTFWALTKALKIDLSRLGDDSIFEKRQESFRKRSHLLSQITQTKARLTQLRAEYRSMA